MNPSEEYEISAPKDPLKNGPPLELVYCKARQLPRVVRPDGLEGGGWPFGGMFFTGKITWKSCENVWNCMFLFSIITIINMSGIFGYV